MSMQTVTWDSITTLVKGLCGVTQFTSDEDDLIAAFINKRLYGAYRRSDLWPRYLVLGEARSAASDIVPFTQATLTNIDTFLRIYDDAPYVSASVREYSFNVTSSGAYVVGGGDTDTYYVDYKAAFDGPFSGTTNDSVPLEFSQYAAHGAYADFLRYDKQQDKAALAEAEAEQLLLLELGNVMLQRTAQVAGRRIRTHSSSQAR
jgi:hypothetical protein